MINPEDCLDGRIDFAKRLKKKTIKKPLSAAAKKDPPPNAENIEKTLAQSTDEAIMQMTSAEIKFQKQHTNYIKKSIESLKGLSHKQIIEKANKSLENIAMHNDLEGD
ncbi:hypothetical protein TVAG_083800 [Trichomonas vaginalis G3]|uniref:Uncharacterized protein n=1 Tax=Trichomonas vaginalis (strain ATCC PRA-98 / G3) TaxID=412133 RepID=A2DMA4_TRIV3|nr:eukaryotic family of unknown function (DUF1754) family [Trichomonas vaginalis G3]EAY18524.1 hypothetical protein TVAG_083800 [Trichomonas vaginalis G3]KAI5489486.1 eukaryotic family of unknown function (DUF1754) family [Trichomonas vaginalis G3]|eukprot:XP_001579510.1 hypothetical protein [Trichomonas vaginalis G3]